MIKINDFSLHILSIPTLIFSLVLIYSCSNHEDQSNTIRHAEYEIKILIRGPGSCAQLISFNKDGRGVAIRGLTDDFYLDNFNNFKTVQIRTSFAVTSEKDLGNINKLIHEIDTAPTVIGGHRDDARRIQIYIHNKLKMDIYSAYTSKVDNVLSILHDHISYNIDRFCSENN